MQSNYTMLMKPQRILLLLLAIFIFCCVFLLDGLSIRLPSIHDQTEAIVLWTSFGFSLLTALIFLLVCQNVLFYARNRSVVLRFLGFSLSMLATFGTLNYICTSPWLSLLNIFSLISALIFLSNLFFSFPDPPSLLAPARGSSSRVAGKPLFVRVLIRSYLWLLSISGTGLSVFAIGVTFRFDSLMYWLQVGKWSYCLFGLTGSLLIFMVAYRQSAHERARQQLLLLGCGLLVTLMPFLFFSVAPHLLGLHGFSDKLALISLCLFPLLSSCAILRYQLCMFDTLLLKILALFFRLAFLDILMYLVVGIGRFLFPVYAVEHNYIYVFCIICSITVFSPFVWWAGMVFTRRCFFSEIVQARRLLDEPGLLTDDVNSIDKAVDAIASAATRILQSTQLCIFVYDEISGQFELYPELVQWIEGPSRYTLLATVAEAFHIPIATAHRLDSHLFALQRLVQVKRPLLLSEIPPDQASGHHPLARFFIQSSPLSSKDCLLTAIRAQGKMIGLLVLGPRVNGLPYAGADLEIAHLLVERFSMVLETARLYARVVQHTSLLNSLYNMSIIPDSAFKTVKEAAMTYAMAVAVSTSSAAEIWLYDKQQKELCLEATIGYGPRLLPLTRLTNLQAADWRSHFYAGTTVALNGNGSHPSSSLPLCLPVVPACPFAWLPLHKSEQYTGVLVITYAHSHVFFDEETRVLEMFASQCLSTLDNVQMTMELRAAYKRQKELDQLKDQFITTASHELRTPLTTVVGYIELLDQYHEKLEASSRSEFIEKARRGCDELNLLMSNILDASLVNLDVEAVYLRPIALHTTVSYVLEIMDAILAREQRPVSVRIADDLFVDADDARLQQILLNLLSNALKYSAAGSPIEIFATSLQDQVIVNIKDYGLGVPPEEQQRLFERFVRLERDINSPVRGAGLGLFICRCLLEAMGGRIWIESSGVVGDGSLVSFALQLAPRI
ncbi:GAF domain-containing sensor histidine kinase [Dictyobacter arantiisoli]|uniref:histidine kinase n=1 Tax=Dictyobacter arantiisoli TaxID=2014874 RepID=A0A5A5T879_9CHLR|nr:ATP-binding protein [Dictyobacter arantiisoli]GCF07681.1 hypothetical protein KDI_12450 [Dictyobacter arantiisoli]